MDEGKIGESCEPAEGSNLSIDEGMGAYSYATFYVLFLSYSLKV